MWRSVAILCFLAVATHASPFPRGGMASVSCDSLCQLAETMSVNQIDVLSASTNGNFNTAALAATCANFDGASADSYGGTQCSGTGYSQFTSDANVASTLHLTTDRFSDEFQYSGQGISPDTGNVCFSGGGHVAGQDSSVWCFDSETAAASLLASGPGGSWQIACSGGICGVKGAMFISSSETVPSFNANQGNCSANGIGWATYNADGYEQVPSSHMYFGVIAGAAHQWFHTTTYATYCSLSGGGELTWNDSTGVASVVGGSTFTTGFPGGGAYNSTDGNVYSLDSNGKFWVMVNPASAGTETQLGTCSWPGGTSEQTSDVIFPDPVTAGQMDYLDAYWPYTSYHDANFIPNITSTSMGTCTTFNFSSAPSLQASTYGMCYDPDTGQILVSDGTGHLAQINFHSSNNPANWTFDADTATLTGHTMTAYNGGADANGLATSSIFNSCAIMPKTRNGGGGIGLAILSAAGQVWVRRMN